MSTTPAPADTATVDASASAGSGTDADCRPVRVLTPAAQRALDEAAERRERAADQAAGAKEIGGRDGPDPVRFGDWEKGGIASDF